MLCLAEPALTWVPWTKLGTLLEGREVGNRTHSDWEDQIPMGFLSLEERGASSQHHLPQGRSVKRRLVSRLPSEGATSPSSLQNTTWRRRRCNMRVTYICGKHPCPPRRGLLNCETPPHRWLFRNPPLQKKNAVACWYHLDSKVIFSLQPSPLPPKRVICQIPNGPRLMDGGWFLHQHTLEPQS